MFKFFHGAPYAVCVELKNFYLFVFCFGGLLFVACGGSVQVWGRMEVCVVGKCGGESGRVGCIRSRV